MKVFMVLVSFGVLAAAQYPGSRQLRQTYGAPVSGLSIAEFSSSSVLRSAPQQGYSSAQQYSAPAPQYNAPARQAQQYSAPAPQYNAPVRQAQQYSAPAPQYNAPARQAQQYSAPAASSQGGYNGASGGYNDGPKGQKIHKHVYIHVAPSEAPEPKAPKAPRAPKVPEKHYKILFIRAPVPPTPEPIDLGDFTTPAPEQKTLVYVLLKKPDATPEVILPPVEATKPSKPEVYFIRYKSPEAPSSDYGAPNTGGAPLGEVRVPSSAYGLQ